MKKLIFGMLTMVFITSCSSNKLTNEIASEIISKKYPTYCSGNASTSVTIWADGFRSQNMADNANRTLNKLRELESQRLVNIKEERTGFTSNPDIKYYIELTQESKKKYNNKIALTSNEFVGIIGISQNENEAIVKYKMKSVKTPFYDLHYKYNGEYKCYETEWEEEITLVKFDTGWKIKTN